MNSSAPDRIEKTLDDLIERTNPGLPPRGAVWGGFVFGIVTGALITYWLACSRPKYEFHTVAPGVIVRVDRQTGEADWALTGGRSEWNHVSSQLP